jgi:hypothetical protein
MIFPSAPSSSSVPSGSIHVFHFKSDLALMGANRKALMGSLWNLLDVSNSDVCSLRWRKYCLHHERNLYDCQISIISVFVCAGERRVGTMIPAHAKTARAYADKR